MAVPNGVGDGGRLPTGSEELFLLVRKFGKIAKSWICPCIYGASFLRGGGPSYIELSQTDISTYIKTHTHKIHTAILMDKKIKLIEMIEQTIHAPILTIFITVLTSFGSNYDEGEL